MNLKNIKSKIQSVLKTSKVTRAMEAVSAVKMRKSQERAFVARPYAYTALQILKTVAPDAVAQQHPYTQTLSGKTAYIVITSDKGLAGSLNSAVLKRTEVALRAHGEDASNTIFVCIGKRGADYFANRGFSIAHLSTHVADSIVMRDFSTDMDIVQTLYSTRAVTTVRVIYTNFISTFEQKAVERTLLPLSVSMLEEMVEHITPSKGMYAFEKRSAVVPLQGYTIEPSVTSVLDALLPLLFKTALFHALLEAKASEHSARMVAMKNATEKSKEVAQHLTLLFNKARQAAITREVSEITSGIEALR
jgi:F-type H+-transporting ATPase subunit gamma